MCLMLQCDWCKRQVKICMNDPCYTLRGRFPTMLTYSDGNRCDVNDTVKYDGRFAFVDRIDLASGKVRIWLSVDPINTFYVNVTDLEFIESREDPNLGS